MVTVTEFFTPKTVQQAAVFLDRNVPGWEHYIDLDLLNMNSYRYCVLGQLWDKHPTFAAARDRTCDGSPYGNAARALGLRDVGPFAEEEGRDSAGPRTRKWAKAVKARLAQPLVRDLTL
jgi:hypothetical protein